MSFEAVPCMFRDPSQENSQPYIGLLIRPSGSNATPGTSTTPGTAIATTSNGAPTNILSASARPGTVSPAIVAGALKGAQPLVVQGSYPPGGPIVINDKVLVPAKMQVRIQGPGGEMSSASVSSAPILLPAPAHHISSNATTTNCGASMVSWAMSSTTPTVSMNSGGHKRLMLPTTSTNGFPVSGVTATTVPSPIVRTQFGQTPSCSFSTSSSSTSSAATNSAPVLVASQQAHHHPSQPQPQPPPPTHHLYPSNVSSANQSLQSCAVSVSVNSSHLHSVRTPSPGYYSKHCDSVRNVAMTVQPVAQAYANPASGDSTTPDSGIQSVAGSPPSNNPLTPPNIVSCSSFCEDRNDEDYADMPRLVPADMEEDDIAPSTSSNSLQEDVNSAHGSECETAGVPAISISTAMDTNEIVEHILKFDPNKADEIAKLIRQKSKQKRKSDTSLEKDLRSKRIRPDSSASEELRRSEEESKVNDHNATSISEPSSVTGLTRADSTPSLTVKPVIPSNQTPPSDGVMDFHDDALSIEPATFESKGSPHLAVAPSPGQSNSVIETFPASTASASQPEPPPVRTDRRLYRHAVSNMLKEKLTRICEQMTDELNALTIGSKRRDMVVDCNANCFRDLDSRRVVAKKREPIVVAAAECPKTTTRARRRKVAATPTMTTPPSTRRPRSEMKKESEIKKERSLEGRRHTVTTPLSVITPGFSTPTSTPMTTPRSVADRLANECKTPSSLAEMPSPSLSRASTRSNARTRQGSITSRDDVKVEVVCEAKPTTDFEEISRSVATSALPSWECGSLPCGCTRGACTSDAECINRALCIQCTPSCAVALCANKKFWREDALRNVVLSGSGDERTIRTKHAKRVGDFLAEFAGEVISYGEAMERLAQYRAQDVIPRILCMTSTLCVDATQKGNVCRFVRHSCEPTARIEVWSVSGTYRAGLFTLNDMPSNTEITVSMDRLLVEEQICRCGADECSKKIRRSRNAFLASQRDMSLQEETLVQKEHLFLLRNRRGTIDNAKKSHMPRSSEPSSITPVALSRLLTALAHRIRRPDGSLPYKAVAGYCTLRRIVALSRKNPDNLSLKSQFFSSAMSWLEHLEDEDLERIYSCLLRHYIDDEDSEKDKKETTTKKKEKNGKEREGKMISRQTDLTYLQSEHKVGSYDPDLAWVKGVANEDEDAVRCVCGSLEEDGDMLQCDSCHFWLHSECLAGVDKDADYKCQFCSGQIKSGKPSTDVILTKQPDVRWEGCKYYKSLRNRRSIQVRLNETVYVEAQTSDEHKKILKRVYEESERRKEKGKSSGIPIPPAIGGKLEKKTFDRKDLRLFRVERLFTTPGNHRFVFGFYYARPHETFCDSQRYFHKSEVFATPLYDTLSLDSVVGRCVVLDPDKWCIGRPLIPEFKECDIYLCDYQVDRNQRSFEKIATKNRYPINSQPYAFKKFDKPHTLKRHFTPFIIASSSKRDRHDSEKMKNDTKSKQRSATAFKTMCVNRMTALADELASRAASKANTKVNGETPKKKRGRKRKAETNANDPAKIQA